MVIFDLAFQKSPVAVFRIRLCIENADRSLLSATGDRHRVKDIFKVIHPPHGAPDPVPRHSASVWSAPSVL